MIAVIAIVGAGFVVISQITTTLYYEELTQRLNAPIAMYVTGEQSLMLQDGSVDEQALRTLAQRAMIINPAVEVYLLDTDGRVLSHALPPETVELEAVDVGPIRELIAGGVDMPFKGEDPRNPDVRKIFSAAEVRTGEELQGYLYVVLGGEKFDQLVTTIRGSYTRALGLWAILALLSLGTAVGLLAFALLTKRLRRLTATVQEFSDSDFEMVIQQKRMRPGNDEIDQLDRAFYAMAVRISRRRAGSTDTRATGDDHQSGRRGVFAGHRRPCAIACPARRRCHPATSIDCAPRSKQTPPIPPASSRSGVSGTKWKPPKLNWSQHEITVRKIILRNDRGHRDCWSGLCCYLPDHHNTVLRRTHATPERADCDVCYGRTIADAAGWQRRRAGSTDTRATGDDHQSGRRGVFAGHRRPRAIACPASGDR